MVSCASRYNLSFAREREVLYALSKSGLVDEVLVPVLDGRESGPCVPLRTLWSTIGLANISLLEAGEEAVLEEPQGAGKQPLLARTPSGSMKLLVEKKLEVPELREREIQLLVAAFDASLCEAALDQLDEELYGTFGCVDITEGHDGVYVCTHVCVCVCLCPCAYM